MKLKRILAMLLACTMTACAFASCGDDDDDDKDEKTTKSDKADDDEDEDEDDEDKDDEDDEEETTKKGKKDKDEEETTEAPEEDDDLDDVAMSLSKAINSALVDMDAKDEACPTSSMFCSDSFDNLVCDDDKSVDFDLLWDETSDYFEDLDDYEFMAVVSDGSCEVIFVSESKNSKEVGAYAPDMDRDDIYEILDLDDDATLSEIYDVMVEFFEEANSESTTTSSSSSSTGKTEADDVAYGVYWAAYWTISDMDTDPDDALITSDEKKNIYDGDFDLADFNANFPDELEFEEIDDKIGSYEYIFCVLDQDIEFAAVAPDFDKTEATIFTYDTDWEDGLAGMTLQDIVDFFNEQE
ncbi:MAG: hypothetical protein IJM44_04510 [Ruminococcus sp.]|nr:hypothetical protein [Ruminococcus sp.]